MPDFAFQSRLYSACESKFFYYFFRNNLENITRKIYTIHVKNMQPRVMHVLLWVIAYVELDENS